MELGSSGNRTFATLRVTLELQRNSLYYKITLVFPSILLQVLMLFVFLLPRGSVLKITLSASLVLTMYVLQKDSTRTLPSFNDSKYPRIIIGLCAGMILGAVTLVTSVLSVTISQLEISPPKLFQSNTVTPKPDSSSQSLQNCSVSSELSISESASSATSCSEKVYLLEMTLLLRELAEDKRERKQKEQKKKDNLRAWQRLESIINVFVAIIFVITGAYFIVTCLLQSN